MAKVSKLKVELAFARWIIKQRLISQGLPLRAINRDALDKASKYLVKHYRKSKAR